MIYALAIILSLIVCWQGFTAEVTSGNISHLKHGRPPNAGAVLFPTIPIIPLVAVGAAWLIQHFIPRYAVWIVVVGFLIYEGYWAVLYAKLKAELNRTIATSKDTNDRIA